MTELLLPGTLYIVSTPIGNLDDISVRAARILSQVDLIAAEDTRHTRILLAHLHVEKPLISFHNYNEARRTPQLIDELQLGKSIALVTDAGTPGISDPAYSIISSAIQHGITVTAIPGASAFLPALIISGLPVDRFVFEGFLPVKKGRTRRLQELRDEPRTIVLYESPHRVHKTLQALLQHLGDRQMALVRELTKKFEEVRRGTVSQILQQMERHRVRGEIVLVVKGASSQTL
jgi:16S rRNA (cytidine1402-2'-O)-methyltransferase